MAGHSKWANIKRHKEKQDAKRGKLYTKLIREITVAARLHGGELESNPRLRTAFEKACEANMTKEVIERAIKRGAGGADEDKLEEIRYEGYGPSGVAVIVDCMTNNRNRTVSEVRHAFTKAGGNLGTSNSVAYLFKNVGQIIFAPTVDAERLMEVALSLSVEDMITHDDNSIDIITTPDALSSVKEALSKAGFKPESAETTMLALTTASLDDAATETVHGLVDALEDLEDVQAVYTNI